MITYSPQIRALRVSLCGEKCYLSLVTKLLEHCSMINTTTTDTHKTMIVDIPKIKMNGLHYLRTFTH